MRRHRVCGGDAVDVKGLAQGLRNERSRRGRGAHQAGPEARALLVRPIDQLERDRRPSRACQAAHHLERGEHSETAV